MTAKYLVADVFDGLKTLEDGSVDLVITSPPFLALRSYLTADHPDKAKEIGSEPTPAAFIDVMLAVTAELRRVLAPHGSICIELGDTYAGSGGAGGDYNPGGWRDGQEGYRQQGRVAGRVYDPKHNNAGIWNLDGKVQGGGEGWPLAKSKTLIPELYRLALAYGINPLTGQESPAGRWRVRNTVTWCRPNPPVGALGDKWRPATSDIVIACTSDKRYWDDIATRRPVQHPNAIATRPDTHPANKSGTLGRYDASLSAGAPLLDYWELPPGGYPGSHYAVYPPALVEPLIKAMAPPKVCQTCGEPSRRISKATNTVGVATRAIPGTHEGGLVRGRIGVKHPDTSLHVTLGFTDCGHDNFRPAHILDPFAGSGTTLAVATGHGHEATGIDLDPRNRDLAYERIGPFLWSEA